MKRREVLQAGLLTLMAGCGKTNESPAGGTGSGPPTVVTNHSQQPDVPESIVEAVLHSLRDKKNGVKNLGLVLDEAGKAKLQQFQDTVQKLPHPVDLDLDYVLMPNSVKVSGSQLTATIRRRCGEGTFRFRIQDQKVVFATFFEPEDKNQRESAYSSWLKNSEVGDTPLELPPDLHKVEEVLRDLTKLKQLRIADTPAATPVFVIFAGLCGHVDRLELLNWSKLDSNPDRLVVHMIGLERAIVAEAELADDKKSIKYIVRLEGKPVPEWLVERITSMK